MSCNDANGCNGVRDNVKEYYGQTIKTKDDFKTSVCSSQAKRTKKHVNDVMKLIHDDIMMTYFGCGLVVPECLEGMTILDLGSGTGRDCFVLSKLVGEDGSVTGIDMTEELLEKARNHIDYHREIFGYKKSNVKFVKGYIENLKDAGIEDNSVDIIISNCVINLCQDKTPVLKEAYRVLKDGGEMFFSDMYADRVLSDEIKKNKVLWGEGLSGALYWKNLYSLAKEIGFETPRRVTSRRITVERDELKKLVGEARYMSIIYRLYKLPAGVDRQPCRVVYDGKIKEYEDKIEFDHSMTFPKNIPVPVDGDTASILSSSRFKSHFELKKLETDDVFEQVFEDEDPFKREY